MRYFYVFLIVLCLSVCGCGDEGIQETLHGLSAPSAPVAITGVPPDIQEMVFGDLDAQWETLLRSIELAEEDNEDPQSTAKAPLHELCEAYELRDYYKKYINVNGIAVMGGDHIPDSYFYAVRELILTMTSKHPELREPLSPNNGFRVSISKYLIIPEETNRGAEELGGGQCGGNSFCAASIYEFDDRLGLKTMVHEFAHALDPFLSRVVPNFHSRLHEGYAKALETGGVWGDSDHYGLTNASEYWAEGAVYWFYEASHPTAGDAFTRVLRLSDPILYALLDESFSKADMTQIEQRWKP